MIGAIIGALNGALSLANKFMDRFREQEQQNTGRKLQQADDLKATVEQASHAVKTSEDVRRLSDAELDDELRRDATAGGRK